VLDVRGDAPPMPEGILELPRPPVTVELILDRLDLFCTHLDRAVEDIIDVFDIDADQ
jgi:hypothetical protein